jgi:hypothetical protein
MSPLRPAFVIPPLLVAASFATSPAAAQIWAGGRERVVAPNVDAAQFGAALGVFDLFESDAPALVVADLGQPDPLADRSAGFRVLSRQGGGFVDTDGLVLADVEAARAAIVVGTFRDGADDEWIGGLPGVKPAHDNRAIFGRGDTDELDYPSLALSGAPAGAGCGASLAAGDFDGDGALDVAVGCPEATVGGEVAAGAVVVGYGDGDGGFTWELLDEDSTGFAAAAEASARFGAALAAGDFDGDEIADLAIGVPGKTIAGPFGAGAVYELFGGAGGLSGVGSLYWHAEIAGVPGVAELSDGFGAALAAGDFDFDLLNAAADYADLAIGVPGDAESTGGSVVVLYANSAGLTTAGAERFVAADFGLTAPGGRRLRLGAALAAGQLNIGGAAELVVGAPTGEGPGVPPPGGYQGAGAVCALYGAASGLDAARSFCVDGGSPEVATEALDFGAALAIGQLDGVYRNDLAVGAPGANELFVFRSALFADGFEGGDARWSFSSAD